MKWKGIWNEFVPKINNWAVCDSCVTSYKFMQKESDFWFDYVKKYAESKNEFELRFYDCFTYVSFSG